jgi:F420-0:gamma-glutamyl ligase
MRLTGTSAVGIRLPIISPKDDLVSIVTSHVTQVLEAENAKLSENDIVAVTEAIVAKAENNYAKTSDIADDIKAKFGDAEIGLVYPILSRNRFLNILKGIAAGAKKVHILLSYPHDEVGNPIMDIEMLDEVTDKLQGKMVTASEFKAAAGEYLHTFTGVDYVDLYKSVGENITVHFSNDPRDILKLTKNVLVAEIHSRHRTKARLEKAGAEKVLTLSDILSTSVNGSGFNPDHGVLGSNLSTEDTLKLFPAKAQDFVNAVQAKLHEKTGTKPEVMVYGDGAFKDPVCGIWELADPVVSPGHTERLGKQPMEIKIKLMADAVFGDLRGEEKRDAVTKLIKAKNASPDAYREGTTPRVYADLIGSLCDLMGGSGDKGTPVIILRGYFDDYSTE